MTKLQIKFTLRIAINKKNGKYISKFCLLKYVHIPIYKYKNMGFRTVTKSYIKPFIIIAHHLKTDPLSFHL